MINFTFDDLIINVGDRVLTENPKGRSSSLTELRPPPSVYRL